MKHLSEYRDAGAALRLAREIAQLLTRPWVLMEVCGGQTHSIVRNGLEQLLPTEIRLVHGPGCPVCVTSEHVIDQALSIASRPEVLFCTYGDMLRIPGAAGDLFHVRAQGGDVRVVYSPLDALNLARQNPDRDVVFFAIGFETTAPAHALTLTQARSLGLRNFSMLIAHVLVPPAIRAIVSDPENQVNAFLAAGHVCTVMGTGAYTEMASEFGVPFVVTGFEPLDLLEGIRCAVRQLEAGDSRVENAYRRVVSEDGNRTAKALLEEVFEVCDTSWRGLGVLPDSGWRLRAAYAEFDAALRFPGTPMSLPRLSDCRAGEVLRGRLAPRHCPEFGRRCTPANPLGAPMVSSEGACAAYYLHDPTGSMLDDRTRLS